MKTKILLLFILSLIYLPVLPQVYKTLNVAAPGTLSTLLTEEERTSVTDLTLTGTIDSVDFLFLRDEMTVLSSLDLSGAATVNNAIYDNALGPKYSLNILLLPPTTIRLGQQSLMSCGFSFLILPPALKIIQNGAFLDCKIKEINIPAQVEIINDAFEACDSLKAITVDENNPNFSSLEGVLFNKDVTQILKYPAKKKGSYQIPNSVTKIADRAFVGCDYLESLYIPGSVNSIGASFPGTSRLTGFDVSTENQHFRDIDGVLYSADTSMLVQYPLNRPGDSYEVAMGTEQIKKWAFSGCISLIHISFPATLITIDPVSFRDCPNLLSIVLPPSLRYLGRAAFANSTNINYIRIPSSVETVGNDFLDGLIGLDTIFMNSKVPLTLLQAYQYFDGIDTINCVLMVPSGSYDAYSNATHWKSFQNIIEYETAFEISQTEFNPAESGEELSFQISTNTEWRIKPTVSWLHFSDTLGMDSKTITVRVDVNTGGDRQANISLIPLDKEPVELIFSQAGSTTAVSEINNETEKLFYDSMNKRVIIKHLSGNELSVFTVDGKLILNRKIVGDYETLNADNLPEGICIVRAGSCTLKIRSSQY